MKGHNRDRHLFFLDITSAKLYKKIEGKMKSDIARPNPLISQTFVVLVLRCRKIEKY